jgi:hypothetical protein
MAHTTALPLTTHAAARANQRGIRHSVIDMLLTFGSSTPAQDGCECIYMDRAARRAAAKELGRVAYAKIERALDAYLILGGDGWIVTCAHRQARVRH